jgi:hypothetical protein
MIIRSFLCILFFMSAASGQAFSETPDAYYIGRGEHASLDGARSRAYANMVEQIQVLVTSTLRTSTSEHASAVQNSAEQSTLSISSIVLRDVQEQVDEKKGVYIVVKYVQRSVVHAIFEQRRRQIIDYLNAAEAEVRGSAAVDVHGMLSNYYKAWLMAGLYPDTISYPFAFGGLSVVSSGIPLAMQRVCDNIVFVPVRKIDDEYTTWKYAVLWAGRPVTTLRYAFHDGLGESEEEVTNGTTQATFLFTDKRERTIPASIEYHETDAQDALLAAADSMRSPYAPKLAIHFPLPGEARSAQDTVSPGSAAAPSVSVARPAQLDTGDTSAFAHGDSPGQHRVLPVGLQALADKGSSLAFFKSEIARLSKRGDIVAGKKGDFESLDGLYLIVLDGTGVQTILYYTNGAYINTRSGETITLPDYAGKRTLWVKVQ